MRIPGANSGELHRCASRGLIVGASSPRLVASRTSAAVILLVSTAARWTASTTHCFLGSSKTVRQYVTHDKFMENRFLASRRARLGENSARATRRSRYCSSWWWRLWLHQGAKGPSGAPDRPILARAPALGRSRGGLGSRSPPLLEAVVFRLFGSRWRRPGFGLSPVAGQPGMQR